MLRININVYLKYIKGIEIFSIPFLIFKKRGNSMKDLLKVKKGITHAGRFHTDDVLSTVLLLELNPNLEIERVSEYIADDSNEEELVYDIGSGEFDHHEEERELDEFGYPYSSFGKLWREFGREYLKQYGFSNIEAAFDKFNRFYVSKVNQGDNTGYKCVYKFYENDLIVRFNPSWMEKKEEKPCGLSKCFVFSFCWQKGKRKMQAERQRKITLETKLLEIKFNF